MVPLPANSEAIGENFCFETKVLLGWTQKGYKSLNSEDFYHVYFTPGWDTVYDHLGDGCRIHFPMEMKWTTRQSKKLYNREEDGTLMLKKSYFVEKVYLRLVK